MYASARQPTATTATRRPTPDPTEEPHTTGCTSIALIFCPCWPMARAAALLGRSYLGTWLLIALLYAGGIACYGAMHVLDEPEYSPVLYAVGPTLGCLVNALIAWLLNMFGAPLAVVFVLLQSLWRVELAGDMYSMTGLILLCVYVVGVVLVYDLAQHLRTSLVQQYGPMPRHKNCLPSSRCCCPVRFLATPLEVAEQRRRELQDELPAYTAV